MQFEKAKDPQNTGILQALKKCLNIDASIAKSFSKPPEDDDREICNIEKLIAGGAVGMALAHTAFKAAEAGGLQVYAEETFRFVSEAISSFAMDNSTALIAGGSILVGVGAITFMKGLSEENELLKERYKNAFEKTGYGPEGLMAASRAHAAILKTHTSITDALTREKEIVKALMINPDRQALKVAKSFGFDLKNAEERHHLSLAYTHGLTKAMADGVKKGWVMKGKEVNHSMLTKQSIIEGMTSYYQSIVSNEPSLLAKVKFMVTGREEDLQKSTVATEIAESGYDLIRDLDERVDKRKFSKEEITQALSSRYKNGLSPSP